MSNLKIRKNDIVMVEAGRDAGKTGKVLQVLPERGRAIVEGVNLVKKAMRKTQDNPQGGIVEKESPLAISNVRVFCPDCKRGVRIHRAREAGKRIRKCVKCQHVFEG
jgi:large subunit ribosomal protein L24